MRHVFYYTFSQKVPSNGCFTSIVNAITAILDNEQMSAEIVEVLQVKYNSLKTTEIEHAFDFPTLLTVHSTYSREQVLAALGYFNEDPCPAFREGVKYFKDKKLDVFFVTLNKPEKDEYL